MNAPAYTIVDARYAKGQKVVRCTSDDGYKTRAMRLAEVMGGRWVHRSGGYTMSPTKAAKFERLYAEGFDASTIMGRLIPPEAKA